MLFYGPLVDGAMKLWFFSFSITGGVTEHRRRTILGIFHKQIPTRKKKQGDDITQGCDSEEN